MWAKKVLWHHTKNAPSGITQISKEAAIFHHAQLSTCWAVHSMMSRAFRLKLLNNRFEIGSIFTAIFLLILSPLEVHPNQQLFRPQAQQRFWITMSKYYSCNDYLGMTVLCYSFNFLLLNPKAWFNFVNSNLKPPNLGSDYMANFSPGWEFSRVKQVEFSARSL